MARGVKTGGGSRKGSPNRRTVARERALAAAAEKIADALGSHAFAGDALGLLQLVYRDGRQPIELRLDAARAAAPYERPRLSAMTANLETGLTLEELVTRSLAAPAEGPSAKHNGQETENK
jgi:hypothetical protein